MGRRGNTLAQLEHRIIPVPESGCWIWEGAWSKKGYGNVRYEGKVQAAHRVFYMLLRGPIPEGLTLDHLCRVRSCVNPDHLEIVTNRVNRERGYSPPAMNRRKTHCKRGHLFDEHNTVHEGKNRHCRKCMYEITHKGYRQRMFMK